jgi:DNA-binding transcriptional ArsR family regulator
MTEGMRRPPGRQDGRADAADDAFRALASPARRRALSLVKDRPLPVGELAAALGVSQPAASQHLAVLREAGLVTVAADGRRRLYRVDLARIAAVRSFFDEYWDAALDRLAGVAEQVAHDRKEAG